MNNIIKGNRRKNYIGQIFGRLTVLADAEDVVYSPGQGKRVVLCLCSCGTQKEVHLRNLVTGNTKSCGCLRKELGGPRKKHGMSSSSEYKSWNNMRSRCTNLNNKSYEHYGGRGITICDKWSKFEAFFEDMGLKPTPKHSIDRIDNNGNYCPENCRWATEVEQQNNKRSNIHLTLNSETKTLTQWTDSVNIKKRTIRARLHKGWDEERAITQPTRRKANN